MCEWWGPYLAERKLQRMDVSEVLEARLDRYRATKASTEKQRIKQIAGAMRALLPRRRWLIWSQTALRWGEMTARAALRPI